jgi:hypothetical protein
MTRASIRAGSSRCTGDALTGKWVGFQDDAGAGGGAGPSRRPRTEGTIRVGPQGFRSSGLPGISAPRIRQLLSEQRLCEQVDGRGDAVAPVSLIEFDVLATGIKPVIPEVGLTDFPVADPDLDQQFSAAGAPRIGFDQIPNRTPPRRCGRMPGVPGERERRGCDGADADGRAEGRWGIRGSGLVRPAAPPVRLQDPRSRWPGVLALAGRDRWESLSAQGGGP